MNYFCRLWILVAAFAAIACSSGDKGQVAGGGMYGDGNTSARATATVDLKCFREQALRSLRASHGDVEFTDEMISFQDGVASADLPPIFDLTRLVFSAKPAGTASFRDSRVRVAYMASLQGFDKLTLVIGPERTDASFYGADSLIGVFREDVTDTEIGELRERIQTEFPEYRQTFLETIRALTLEDGNPAELAALERALSASGAFSAVDLNGEVYRMPFRFDKPVILGSGLASESVDLDSLRTISREYREQGVPFTTESQLPAIRCDPAPGR